MNKTTDQKQAMTDPQSPAGETPEVDAAIKTFTLNIGGIPTTLDGEWVPVELARKLSKENAALAARLADTEARMEQAWIDKGITSLQTQLGEERAIVDRVWKALGVTTYEDAQGKAIDELVAEHRSKATALTAPSSDILEYLDGVGTLGTGNLQNRAMTLAAALREAMGEKT